MKKSLHPLTLWIGVTAIATAVVIADSAYFAMAAIGAALLLVILRRDGSPWNATFWWSLRIAGFIVALRAVIGVLIGVPIPGTVLFHLPRIHLPQWMPGIRIGGDVTLERVSASLHEGLVIASIIVLFGAASSLTSPHKLLRVLPVFIYEIGITLVIATSVFPQLAKSVSRIRRAQQLRGMDRSSIRSIATPLLEEALLRSLQLAESMDSRGYGVSRKRSRYRPERWQIQDSLWVGASLSTAVAMVIA
jgi:energy-coupling factor transporter transmembrane protein EcfT